MSSRRHEQAEREAIEEAVTDYAKLAGFAIVGTLALVVICGPWVEWKQHGHQWGWALLGVFDDLICSLIVIAIIAAKVGEARDKQPKKTKPALLPSAGASYPAAQAFEKRARRVAASTIELRDIDNSLLRARVKNIREGRQ